MSTEGDFRRIGIVGVGLIGGSLAFAVRRVFPDAAVIGIDRDDVTLVARQLGALTVGSRDLSALADADLVVLAAPVRQNIAVLSQLGSILRGPALVTDVGSTKRATLAASRGLPPSVTFIGGHPLAGSARGGLEASRADLFERRPWLLTPDAATPTLCPGTAGGLRPCAWAPHRSSSIRRCTITSWHTRATCRNWPPAR